jgi:hypothetical protein
MAQRASKGALIARAAGLAALAATVAAAVPAAFAQTAGSVSLEGIDSDAAFAALAKECYDAGMAADMPSDFVMDCSAILEERSSAGPSNDENDVVDTVVLSHKLRFTLNERADESSIAADAWTEIAELGTVVEEPITTEEYLRRVQSVLTDVGKRLRASAGAPPLYSGRYESEQAWHLDAHLRAVRYCDANLASMEAGALRGQLESIGVRPLAEDARDLCEQLYQPLFEWGLVRGDAEPTVEKYSKYRAGLPPEQRACAGRLALETSCR